VVTFDRKIVRDAIALIEQDSHIPLARFNRAVDGLLNALTDQEAVVYGGALEDFEFIESSLVEFGRRKRWTGIVGAVRANGWIVAAFQLIRQAARATEQSNAKRVSASESIDAARSALRAACSGSRRTIESARLRRHVEREASAYRQFLAREAATASPTPTSKAVRRALDSYQEAVGANSRLAKSTKRVIWKHLREHGSEAYPADELPSFDTWSRQLRKGMSNPDKPRSNPRRGRSAPGIAKHDEV